MTHVHTPGVMGCRGESQCLGGKGAGGDETQRRRRLGLLRWQFFDGRFSAVAVEVFADRILNDDGAKPLVLLGERFEASKQRRRQPQVDLGRRVTVGDFRFFLRSHKGHHTLHPYRRNSSRGFFWVSKCTRKNFY